MGTMSGVNLTSAVITGIKQGVADSADTLGVTLNNQYLGELALMFIGFALVTGIIIFLVARHKGHHGKISDGGFYSPLDRGSMLSRTEAGLAVNQSALQAYRTSILAKRYGGEDDIPLNVIDSKEYNRVKREGRA